MMGHLNVEFKAKCSNVEKIREILKNSGADFKGIDRQIDTYFQVNKGRLKLREGNIENHLIYYEREDKGGSKQSKVILYKTVPESPIKEILRKSVGVLAIVDKKREIYFIENVKFHVDLVEGLGEFIEVEAIDYESNIGEKRLQEQCDYYKDLLEVKESDFISVSYSDLIMQNQ